jgi:hypothetical protein
MWPETNPVNFCIWGHMHYTHTHSYIHYGFYNAAKHLGWNVEWLDNTVENGISLKNTDTNGWLFFTESQVDSHLPRNPHAFYIVHNCNANEYLSISLKNILSIQTFMTNVITRNVVPINNNNFELWDSDSNVFYMPWATDILPEEINKNIKNLKLKSNGDAIFLGTYGSGIFGNCNEIDLFQKRCNEKNIPFELVSSLNVDQTKSIEILKSAFITPSIVGTWQKEQGYIPCRIFKTISYGQLGVTNCKNAYEIINKLGVYNENESNLVDNALEKINDFELRIKSMELVRDKHTYLNRISSLQRVFKLKFNIS